MHLPPQIPSQQTRPHLGFCWRKKILQRTPSLFVRVHSSWSAASGLGTDCFPSNTCLTVARKGGGREGGRSGKKRKGGGKESQEEWGRREPNHVTIM